MTRYLLDTNILSDLVRNPGGRIAEKIREAGEINVCTSVIVAAELRYGATKKGSPKLRNQVNAVLGALEVLPLESPADQEYGNLRVRLEREGLPIGGNDMLIGAQALALGYTLVTANADEFSRIRKLHSINWLRD